MGLSKHEYKSIPAPDAEKEVAMDRVTALMQKLEEVDAKLVAWDRKQWEQQPRRLGTGQVVPLGDPRGTRLGGGSAPGVIHSRGESAYSLTKAMRSVFARDKSLAPLEWALSEKLEQLGYHSVAQGMQIPLGLDVWTPAGREPEAEALNAEIKSLFPPLVVDPEEVSWLVRKMGAKAMDPLDASGGGSLVAFPAQGPMIDALRAASVALRAGAYPVPLPPQGSIAFPRLMADASFTWGPPSNIAIDGSEPDTGVLTMTAKKASALVLIPQDLVRYSLTAAEVMVRQSLTKRGALTLDLAALEGSGGTLAPMGISNYPRSSADEVTLDCVTLHIAKGVGASGDRFDPSDVLAMIANVEEANTSPTGFILRPRMWSGILNARADAVVTGDGAGLFLFSVSRGAVDAAMPSALSGVPVYTSTQVSRARVKGSGSGLTYIVCGDWSKLYVGQGAAVEITASTDYKFAEDQLALKAILRADTGAAWPQAFTLCDQLLIP